MLLAALRRPGRLRLAAAAATTRAAAPGRSSPPSPCSRASSTCRGTSTCCRPGDAHRPHGALYAGLREAGAPAVGPCGRRRCGPIAAADHRPVPTCATGSAATRGRHDVREGGGPGRGPPVPAPATVARGFYKENFPKAKAPSGWSGAVPQRDLEGPGSARLRARLGVGACPSSGRVVLAAAAAMRRRALAPGGRGSRPRIRMTALPSSGWLSERRGGDTGAAGRGAVVGQQAGADGGGEQEGDEIDLGVQARPVSVCWGRPCRTCDAHGSFGGGGPCGVSPLSSRAAARSSPAVVNRGHPAGDSAMTVTVPGGTSVSPASTTRSTSPAVSASNRSGGGATTTAGQPDVPPRPRTPRPPSPRHGACLGERLARGPLQPRVVDVGDLARPGLGGLLAPARRRWSSPAASPAAARAPSAAAAGSAVHRVAGQDEVRLGLRRLVPLPAAGAQADLPWPRQLQSGRLRPAVEPAHALDRGGTGERVHRRRWRSPRRAARRGTCDTDRCRRPRA